MKEIGRCFEAKMGIKVDEISQNSPGEGLVKLEVMRGKSVVDVWFTTPNRIRSYLLKYQSLICRTCGS